MVTLTPIDPTPNPQPEVEFPSPDARQAHPSKGCTNLSAWQISEIGFGLALVKGLSGTTLNLAIGARRDINPRLIPHLLAHELGGHNVAAIGLRECPVEKAN